MTAKPKPGTFSVTGPGLERHGYPSGPIALSASITFAGRAEGEACFYVRDHTGEIWGRSERDAGGNVLIYRLGKDDR